MHTSRLKRESDEKREERREERREKCVVVREHHVIGRCVWARRKKIRTYSYPMVTYIHLPSVCLCEANVFHLVFIFLRHSDQSDRWWFIFSSIYPHDQQEQEQQHQDEVTKDQETADTHTIWNANKVSRLRQTEEGWWWSSIIKIKTPLHVWW